MSQRKDCRSTVVLAWRWVCVVNTCLLCSLQMANNLEGGKTPQLPPAELQRLGFPASCVPSVAAGRVAAGDARGSGWDRRRPCAGSECTAVVSGEPCSRLDYYAICAGPS